MFLDSDQEKQTLRERTLPTKYGDVFCLEVGQVGQPLILVIHGSGPKNSSKVYEPMLHEYAVRISTLERYYLLAIDCPGYGKSTGSKEAIKTFPLQFLKNILEILGYKSYYALFGHSQGGAAIFNAVYECPTLTQFMVQERPVCGNISRFNGFQVPTLLIYDIEDDGHPIWQGKQLFKNLKKSEIYTFRSSVAPFYVPDNIWNLMLQFFDKHKKGSMNQFRSQSKDVSVVKHPVGEKKREYSCEEKKEKEREGSVENGESQGERQLSKMKLKQKPEVQPPIRALQKVEESPLEFSIIDQKEQCSDLIVRNKNKNPLIKQQTLEKEKQEVKQTVIQKESPKEQLPPAEESKREVEKQMMEENENRCSLCLESYFHPTRINCKHIFCWKCITEAMLVNPKCPLCRRIIQKRQEDITLHQQIIAKMESHQLNKKLFQYKKFLRMMDSIVFVEIGNTALLLNTKQSSFTKTKKKYNWELFVTETPSFRFESVEFNINMGEASAKPVKIKQAPWTFANRGTFEFGCQIKIIPKSQSFNPLVVIYRVCLEPGRHSRKVAIRRKEFK